MEFSVIVNFSEINELLDSLFEELNDFLFSFIKFREIVMNVFNERFEAIVVEGQYFVIKFRL